jgi:hypothetical protein
VAQCLRKIIPWLLRTHVFCRLNVSTSKSSKLDLDGITPGSVKAVKMPKSIVTRVQNTPIMKAHIRKLQFSKLITVVAALKH